MRGRLRDQEGERVPRVHIRSLQGDRQRHAREGRARLAQGHGRIVLRQNGDLDRNGVRAAMAIGNLDQETVGSVVVQGGIVVDGSADTRAAGVRHAMAGGHEDAPGQGIGIHITGVECERERNRGAVFIHGDRNHRSLRDQRRIVHRVDRDADGGGGAVRFAIVDLEGERIRAVIIERGRISQIRGRPAQ